jgi:Uma2 family endonuclease
MSGSTRNHNRVSGNFFKILDDSLANSSCEVYIVDVKVQVELGQKYFYPDVVVTCDERERNPQLIQYPCLIIEVLSPSTEAADRGKKFAAYRQILTLQEYVLVQVAQPGVEVFRRNEQGKWVLSDYSLGDRLLLESLNIEIAMAQRLPPWGIADLYKQVQFEVTHNS